MRTNDETEGCRACGAEPEELHRPSCLGGLETLRVGTGPVYVRDANGKTWTQKYAGHELREARLAPERAAREAHNALYKRSAAYRAEVDARTKGGR